MSPTATTVGGYLRDLPADRRVAMARVCSMIRRSARGVRESTVWLSMNSRGRSLLLNPPKRE